MSDADASRSFLDGSPFATFNTLGDTRSGIDLFFSSLDLFSFLPPPYNLTDADVLPTPGRPFLTVHPEEIGFSTVQVSEDSWKALYFLVHPAIYRLLLFAWVPERIRRMDPGYLATILDRAVPVFETLHRAYPLVPHTRTFMTLLVALVHLVLVVRELIPTCARDDWLAFLPEGESAHSELWDMYPPLSFGWVFPCTQEFPEDQPLCDTFLLADHVTLQRIARPSFHALAAFLAKGRVYDATDLNRVVQLLDDAIAPENATFASMLLPCWFTIPCGPHEDSLEEPYPVQSMSAFDSVWHWWRRIQAGYSQPGKTSSPRRSGSPGSRAGTYSPHYEPSTLPECSATPLLGPVTPPPQTGPSAVGSASFDICSLLSSARKDPPTPRKASAIAASLSNSAEMQVDPPEMSSADALAIVEAMDDLPPHTSSCSVAHPVLLPEASKSLTEVHLPCILPLLLRDKKGRPMIRIKSSQKSITPPASEAYNEEGEEEKEDGEDEEEEEEEPPRPVKYQRTAPASSKSKSSGKGKGKGKVRANTPAPLDTSARFPITVRKTRRKNKKGEVPSYVPPQPVPSMDVVTLAAETLANGQREPTVFDAGCSNCILRDRECDHGAPCSLCEHCDKGCLSHCSHTFAVANHARAANHLEPYTRLSNKRGNELITDLSAARASYKLTHLGPYGLPRMLDIPEALRPLWGQLLIDAEAELSVDYRAAIMRYPFISDPRRTDLPTDEDLPTLLEFLTRRAAHAHQPTPPPEDSSNWPDEGEAGPSGSK
ncbi:hypothetical protein B0H14DRAFT_2566708 [Mycena olivaceomarginata]|nr:hypothetical protein B0H14DRAFT_2566708 [Mycena olivaceomarginata]